jgi:hypothetical protein
VLIRIWTLTGSAALAHHAGVRMVLLWMLILAVTAGWYWLIVP